MNKILIVEDDNASRRLMKILINDIGYTDVLADSGELAWEILKVNHDFDLIITDVVLGGMTGLDLIHKIKENPSLKDIPIYVCSSQLSKNDVLSYLKVGIQLFMEKPLNGKKLQGHILKLLEPDLSKTNYKL